MGGAARAQAREWTDERIEAELRKLCAGRDTWPTVAEFRTAGKASLYEAIMRYGGRRRWAARLGLD